MRQVYIDHLTEEIPTLNTRNEPRYNGRHRLLTANYQLHSGSRHLSHSDQNALHCGQVAHELLAPLATS